MFSLKTGTIMQGSNLGYQIWTIAIYLLTTKLKGVSSMKLHRDLGITQKSVWHLAHRLRRSFKVEDYRFSGTVEVRHRNYQPSVAELREDVNISTTPAQLAKAVVRDVVISEVKKK